MWGLVADRRSAAGFFRTGHGGHGDFRHLERDIATVRQAASSAGITNFRKGLRLRENKFLETETKF